MDSPPNSEPLGFPGTLSEAVELVLIENYLAIASAVLVTYDTVLTLQQEIRLVWHGRWGTPSVLYMLTRYGVVIQAGLNLIPALVENMSMGACYSWSLYGNWSIPVVTLLIEAMVALRIIALYGNTHIVFRGVWLLYAGTCTAMFVLMGQSLSGSYAVSSLAPTTLRCSLKGLGSEYWALYIPSLIFESVIALLTLARAIYHKRVLAETPLLLVLIRDGFIYFFVIFVLMVLIVIVSSTGDALYDSWAPQMSLTLFASIMASRLFLNLRETARRNGHTQSGQLEMQDMEKSNVSAPSSLGIARHCATVDEVGHAPTG